MGETREKKGEREGERNFNAISWRNVEGACPSRSSLAASAKRASLTNLSITVWQPSGLSTFAPRLPTTTGIQLSRRSSGQAV